MKICVRHAALVGLCLALVSGSLRCFDNDGRVREARALLDQGRFDVALEAYERLYQSDPRDPGVLAGLGLLLTLRPISVFAGVDLLEASLGEEPNDRVREDLVLLYVTLGRFDRARRLFDPARISIDEVYSPFMTRLRLGVSCLEAPDATRLRVLGELAPHPRRDYFLVLCTLRSGNRPETLARAVALYRGLTDRAVACELAVLWPRDREPEPGFRVRELAGCRRAYPGTVAIQREVLPVEAATLEDPRRPGRTLFNVDVFQPEDPGAELDKLPWYPVPVNNTPAGPNPAAPAEVQGVP